MKRISLNTINPIIYEGVWCFRAPLIFFHLAGIGSLAKVFLHLTSPVTTGYITSRRNFVQVMVFINKIDIIYSNKI